METRQVSTPKSFFVKERDQFYSDWMLSFWREFFQNSVDAGAKNISIDIAAAAGRGSFAEAGDSSKEVTRIVFEDDGCGMDRDVLDRVYFAIGQTTKGEGGSVGGYGRARLMTCFSQARYSILTTDRFVMGDGPDYVNLSLAEAEDALSKAVLGIGEGNDADTSRAALERDLALIRAARQSGGFKGCRVEVDCDLTDTAWDNPTPDRMAARLKDYLSESQVAAAVTVDGMTPEERFAADEKLQARRGPARRTLTCHHEGENLTFAAVHVSGGEKARHKGRLIVRVDGAAMYSKDIRAAEQVIVEVDRELSRRVLNSNRDGMKPPFNGVLDAFVAELTVDTETALADLDGRDSWKVDGERGTLTALVPKPDDLVRSSADGDELAVGDRVASGGIGELGGGLSTLEGMTARGLTEDDMEALVMDARFGNGLISEARWVPGFALAADAREFMEKVGDWKHSYEKSERADFLIRNASDRLKEWLVRAVSSRRDRAVEEVRQRHDERLKDMNDVYVRVLATNPKTRAAVRRNDPRRWSVETGKGRAPRALLAAWTAACAVAVETLVRKRPSLEGFEWTTGWVYSVPEERQQGDGSRRVSVEALFAKGDGVSRFLLNPVRDDGSLRYSVSDAKDRQRLLVLAMHEVSHQVADWHDETFAGTMTDLMMEVDMAEANRRMKDTARAVMAAYETGRARVQAMDAECGPRPSERLMACASGSAHDGFSSSAASQEDDGTWTVDCGAIDRPTDERRHDGGYGMAAAAPSSAR